MTTTKIDLQKLRKHLAHHMKTTHQVTTTLTNAGIKEPELTQIITTLTQEKYLNDAEYVAEYIRTDRAKNKHTSAEKIKHTLTHQHGIDPNTVEDVLSEMGAYNENLPQAIKHAEKSSAKQSNPTTSKPSTPKNSPSASADNSPHADTTKTPSKQQSTKHAPTYSQTSSKQPHQHTKPPAPPP